jgi:hypothetical protein
MSNSPETSIFGISDASAVDRTPYRVKEPWIKGRWIFRYTVGFDLIDGLAREPVNFKVYFLIFNKIKFYSKFKPYLCQDHTKSRSVPSAAKQKELIGRITGKPSIQLHILRSLC